MFHQWVDLFGVPDLMLGAEKESFLTNGTDPLTPLYNYTPDRAEKQHQNVMAAGRAHSHQSM